MAPAIPFIMIAASSAMGAFGSIEQGIQQKKASEAEAQQDVYQGQQEMQAAGARVSANDYQALQTLSKINANAGAAGVTGQGSPSLVGTRSAEEAKINDMYTMYSGQLASQRDLYAGDVARYKGNQAEMQGFIGAGGSLLQGASKAYGLAKYGAGGAGAIGGGDGLGGSGGSMLGS